MAPHAAPTTSAAPATAHLSRRARREQERAGVAARLRRGAAAHPALTAGLAGALAIVLPAAGLTLSDAAPAYAAVPTADESVVGVLDRASADAEVDGGVYAGSLTLDAVGAARAELVASSLEIDPAQCAPAQAANGAAAALTAAPGGAGASGVAVPVAEGSYEITSPFGGREHPIFGDARHHDGTDFAAPAGTPISAVAAGTVIHSGDNIGAPGTLVVIEHELGGQVWTSWYLHMYEQDIAVSAGQQVEAGQLVGLVGSAGNSTGPHLHLEIHEGPGTGGQAVDPLPWLAQHSASAATC